MDAVAAYLREIRQGRGFTQETLAEAVGVSKRTIERLERNEGDITVPTFELIIRVLQASAEQINYLATTSTASIQEARGMAKLWLQNIYHQEMLARKKLREESVTPNIGDADNEQVQEALELIRALRSDPKALSRLLGYGQSLLGD